VIYMATIMSVFPVITTVVAVIFTYLVFQQWRRRKRLYQFIWFISLIMFAVTAAFEALSEFVGWNAEIYKLYLVLSASQVAIMGGGALYLILAKNVFSTRGLLAIDGTLMAIIVMFSFMMTLSTRTDYTKLAFGAAEYPIAGIGTYSILIILAILFGRNMKDQEKKMLHGHIYMVFGIILTLWMGIYAATAQVMTENFVSGIAVAGNAMPYYVRDFSPLMSVTGGFLLIGAAFFSYIKTRFNFNLWIAIGGLAISIAGAIARGGIEFGNVLYIGEVIGVFMLTKGFMDSDKVIRDRAERTRPKASNEPESVGEASV
jgi:hypothetical protein